MLPILRNWPELTITGAMLVLVWIMSRAIGVPISLPQGEGAAFVGIHYLYPLIGVVIWGLIALFGQRRNLASTFLVALPCYAAMLVCHFNLKLWRPFINPTEWDSLYWSIDQALYPLVAGAIAIRTALLPIIPHESNYYMVAFIAMFYASFSYQALLAPHKFRALFLAALIFQGAGALAYLVMPALGPFIYETGVTPTQTMAQQGMLDVYRDLVAGGPAWIAENGDANITAGLAAMPSLHTGGSFLFLLFAWRHARVLMPLYCLLFGFILVTSIASRWHYLIDLPVGLALAWFSAWSADRLIAWQDRGAKTTEAAPASNPDAPLIT